jgi:hypothetical protein
VAHQDLLVLQELQVIAVVVEPLVLMVSHQVRFIILIKVNLLMFLLTRFYQ